MQKPGAKVVVVGTSGCGKTHLARTLAEMYQLKHIELDGLNFEPDWVEVDHAVFRKRVSASLDTPRWVVDGNYTRVSDIVWTQADTLIWLDYSLPVVLGRLTLRTLRRIVSREELWNGNREDWSKTFSRDSVFYWAVTTFKKKREEYTKVFASSEYRHLTRIRLESPSTADQWLRFLRN